MPKSNTTVAGTKYSNPSAYRLLRSRGTRTFSRHQVHIVGRNGRDMHTYRFTFTIYERQSLYALGEAVARFFVMNPRGSISSISVNTLFQTLKQFLR